MSVRLGFAVVLLASNVAARGQGAIWHDAWYTVGQPGLMVDDIYGVATSTGQFVYAGDIYGWSTQVTSLTPAGAVNWQVNVPEFASGPYGLAAGVDGAVFFGATKIDASGHIVWYRNDMGARISTLTADAYYVANCRNLASLDLNTGATRWSVDRGSPAHCNSSIGSDAFGNIYLVAQDSGPPYTPLPPIHLSKYDASGVTKWDLSIAPTQIDANFIGAGLIGAADGRVFISAGSGPVEYDQGSVAAFDADSGALLWARAQTQGQLLAGIPASPLSADSNGTHRLDAADGHVLWTQPFYGGLPYATADGNDIYVCTGNGLSKLDASTGNAVWSKTYGNFGGSCLAPILSAGNLLSPTFDFGPGVLNVDAIDAATGTLVSQSPVGATQQAISTWDSFVDQGRIVEIGQVGNARGNERLRSVDASNGTVDWDVPVAVPVSSGQPLLGRTSDSIIVSAYSGYSSYNLGAIYWVGSVARSDGSSRWTTVGPTFFQSYLWQSYVWASAPLTDSQGNVFVSYSALGNCYYNSGTNCPTASLVKLAAADGAVLWHFDSLAAGAYTAPPFTLIGDDILVAGYFSAPFAGNNVVRLSGSDGSVLWSAAPFTNDASTGVAVNPDGTILVTGASSRALLQPSGEIVWTDHPLIPCLPNCAVDGQVQLADGTVLLVGGITDPVTGAISGWVGAQPLVQNAPIQTAPIDADAPADVRALPLQIVVGSSGVWIAGYMRQPPYTHFYFVAKVDPATLAVSDQQVLAADNADAFAPGSGFQILGAPEADRLTASTYNYGGVVAPTSGAAVLNAAIDAHGDLALRLDSADGPNTPSFHATVTYSGDKPLTGVRLTIWHKGYDDAGSVACATTNASNCAAESRSGYVDATVDMQPGGSAVVSGTYALPNELVTLYGAVSGPPSLAETTLGNNFRSAPIGDLLFHNGFD